MTNKKPVWLLDIDGVINACAVGHVAPTKSFPRDTWKLVDGWAMGQRFPIRYSTAMIDRINQLSELCEIRWHTTWQHDAAGLGETLGLSEFEVAWDREEYVNSRTAGWGSFIPEPEAYDWWKMYAAVDVVNVEKRPLVWTDDDLFKSYVKTFEDDLLVPGPSYILVRPNTNVGLLPKDLDSIEQFIRGSKEGQQASVVISR